MNDPDPPARPAKGCEMYIVWAELPRADYGTCQGVFSDKVVATRVADELEKIGALAWVTSENVDPVWLSPAEGECLWMVSHTDDDDTPINVLLPADDHGFPTYDIEDDGGIVNIYHYEYASEGLIFAASRDDAIAKINAERAERNFKPMTFAQQEATS